MGCVVNEIDVGARAPRAMSLLLQYQRLRCRLRQSPCGDLGVSPCGLSTGAIVALQAAVASYTHVYECSHFRQHLVTVAVAESVGDFLGAGGSGFISVCPSVQSSCASTSCPPGCSSLLTSRSGVWSPVTLNHCVYDWTSRLRKTLVWQLFFSFVNEEWAHIWNLGGGRKLWIWDYLCRSLFFKSPLSFWKQSCSSCLVLIYYFLWTSVGLGASLINNPCHLIHLYLFIE